MTEKITRHDVVWWYATAGDTQQKAEGQYRLPNGTEPNRRFDREALKVHGITSKLKAPVSLNSSIISELCGSSLSGQPQKFTVRCVQFHSA